MLMKRHIVVLKLVAFMLWGWFAASTSWGAVVFNNANPGSFTQYFYDAGTEFGNEIVMAADPNPVTQFQMDYYLQPGASGNETVTIRFYANTGSLGSPGTLIFSSGPLPIHTGYETMTLDKLNLNLPTDFTWTATFGGISGGEQAGLLIYNPVAAVGRIYNDIWVNTGGKWGLTVLPGTPSTFGAVVTKGTVAPTPPTITSGPSNIVVAVGSNVTFTVTATGTGLSYQWFYSSTLAGAPGTGLLNQSGSSLALPGVQSGQSGFYSVSVSSVGGTVTSLPAQLSVLTPVTITQGPASQTVAVGGAASLNVRATGSLPLSYQWYFNGAALPTETGSTLALSGITTAQAGPYFVVVSNLVSAVTSTPPAVLTVLAPVKILSWTPFPSVPKFGDFPATLNVAQNSPLTITATVSGTPPFTFYWFDNYSGPNPIIHTPQSPTDTYSPSTALLSFPSFPRVINLTVGNLPTTNPTFPFAGMDVTLGVLNVGAPPSVGPITVSPQGLFGNNQFKVGESTALSVQPGGTSTSLQWYFSAAGSTYTPVANGAAATLPLNSLAVGQSGTYSVQVSNPFGPTVSNAVSLSVISVTPASITGNPPNLTVVQGGTAIFKVTAIGTPAPIYTWTFHSTGPPVTLSDSATISGSKTDTLTIGNVQQANAGTYRVSVQNTVGNKVIGTDSTSANVGRLTVIIPPTITGVTTTPAVTSTVTGRQDVSANEGGSFSLQVNYTGGVPAPSFQWSFVASGAAERNLPGATDSRYSIQPVALGDAGFYFVTLTQVDSAGKTVTTTKSLATVLTVNPKPSVTISGAPTAAVIAGTTVTLTANPTGTGPFTYQWRKGNAPLNRANTVANQQTLVLNNVQPSDIGAYSVKVQNAAGVAESSPVNLDVQLAVGSFADNFTTIAPALTVSGFVVRGNNASATSEAGEPQLATGFAPQKTVWLAWKPAVSGVADLDTSGSAFDTVLAVFTGTSLSSLSRITYNDDPPNRTDRTSKLKFNATANTTYLIAVGGYNGASGSIVLTANLLATTARVPIITGQPVSQNAFFGSRTLSVGVDATGIGLVTYEWYKNGILNQTTSTPSISVPVDPFTLVLSLGNWYVRISNADANVNNSQADYTVYSQLFSEGYAFPGSVFYLGNALKIGPTVNSAQPQSRSDISSGPTLQGITPRLQALVGSSQPVLSDIIGTNYLSNFGAVPEPGQPNLAGLIGGAPALMLYRPTVSGTAQFTTKGSTFDAAIGAFSGPGDDWTNMVMLAQDHNSGGTFSAISFPVVANQTYLILVDGVNAAVGLAVINYTLAGAPAITQQPSANPVALGGTLSLSVAATNSAAQVPLSYQWRLNGIPLTNATSTTYTVSNFSAANVGLYDVQVSNLAGTVASQAVQVGLATPVTVTAAPQNVSVAVGGTAQFEIQVNGSLPLNFAWRFNGVAIAGETNSVLQLTGVQAAQAGTYQVVVGNSISSVTNQVTLTVIVPPTIVAQPQSQTVPVGAAVSLSATAAGTAPLAYQWQFFGANISGATNPVLVLNNVQGSASGSYTLTVANSAGSASSQPATLTVMVPVTIVQGPQPQTVSPGTTVTFNVVATGTAPLSYQWLLNGSPLAGQTNTVLTLANVQGGQSGAYAVAVTNPAGTATSSAATLTVNVPPTITVGPASQTVIAGSNVVFAVTAAGTSPLSYQWLLNGNPLAGQTNATLALANVQPAQAGAYSVTVNNVAGGITSAAATLTVNVPPSITTSPANQTIVFDQTTGTSGTATFTVTASGTSPLSYQWLFNSNALAGQTNTILSLANVQTNQAGLYAVRVSNVAGSVTSIPATLTVNVVPVITQQPLSQTVLAGTNVILSVTASGTAPLSYQWQLNGNNLAGQTSSTLLLASVQASQAGIYTVVVSNPANVPVKSAPATLTVNTVPVITVQPLSLTGALGSNVTFTVSATGPGILRYSWSHNGAVIPGATQVTLSLNNISFSDIGNYTVTVANDTGQVISSVATLSLVTGVAITQQPQGQNVAGGATVTLTVAATGTAPISYQWQLNGTNVAGATNTTLTLANVQLAQAGSYQVVVSNAGSSVTSTPAVLSILVHMILGMLPVASW